jgi:hypothetical protein
MQFYTIIIKKIEPWTLEVIQVDLKCDIEERYYLYWNTLFRVIPKNHRNMKDLVISEHGTRRRWSKENLTWVIQAYMKILTRGEKPISSINLLRALVVIFVLITFCHLISIRHYKLFSNANVETVYKKSFLEYHRAIYSHYFKL